jgi:hypothetical protein
MMAFLSLIICASFFIPGVFAESKMDIDNKSSGALTFWYFDQKAGPAHNSLRLDEKGALTMGIDYSTTGMAARALGTYLLPVDGGDADVAAIRKEVQKLRAAGYKAVDPGFAPDMDTKSLKIGLDGYELNYISPADQPLPPELVPIENGIIRLMDRAAKKPVAALAMKLALAPEKLRVGDPLRIEIELSNPGYQPVDFLSPLTIVPAVFERFELNFVRLPINAKHPEGSGWCWLNLAGRELQVVDGGTLSRAPVRLDPGKVLKLSTTLPLPRCKRGSYMVELVYSTISPSAPQPAERIFGELHTERVPLTMVWLKP